MSDRLGVCTWSLQPESPTDLAEKLGAVGVDFAQLALEPVRSGAWTFEETVVRIAQTGVELVSGMMEMVGEDYSTLESIQETGGVRPDATWEANLRAAEENAKLARRFSLELVSFHAGFLPHERGDAERTKMIERLRQLVDVFADVGIEVAFETGQESASTLLGVLEELDRPDVGVNFDPANMILYGMGDPIPSLKQLAPCVRQVHIKDATATNTPGTWGEEVVVGTGEVDWSAFLATLEADCPVDQMIEREAGDARVADILEARRVITELSP